MRLVEKSYLNGECQGWDGATKFALDNGQVWEQAVYKYRYFYIYRPLIKIWQDGGRYLLEVQGQTEMLPVRRLQ